MVCSAVQFRGVINSLSSELRGSENKGASTEVLCSVHLSSWAEALKALCITSHGGFQELRKTSTRKVRKPKSPVQHQ